MVIIDTINSEKYQIIYIIKSITIAKSIFFGGSLGLNPESFWKKTNQGNLIPACRKTPADAATRRIQTLNKCS